jgi:predicted nucleic acid-binding protein
MAKLFLDTNIFIDILKKRTDREFVNFQGHELSISPLSIHILAYIYKHKIPSHELDIVQKLFNIIPFTETITANALIGPTSDFEDNVQLHSAAEEACDVFLTKDKQLLSMKFFGKVRIIEEYNP